MARWNRIRIARLFGRARPIHGSSAWKSASRLPGPSFALKYLIAELTANTTAYAAASEGRTT